MENVDIKSCGHKFTIAEPTTVEEYDQLGKAQGICLRDARKYTRFHVTLGDVRETFADLVAGKTKIDRKEIDTGKKDSKGQPVTKTEPAEEYISRVIAEQGLSADTQPFAAEAALCSVGGANEVKFDPSATERKSGPKKLPDDYRNAATRVVDNGTWDKNRKVLATSVDDGGFYGKDIGEQPADREVAITTLGWAIREFTLNKQRAEAQAAWK